MLKNWEKILIELNTCYKNYILYKIKLYKERNSAKWKVYRFKP